MLLNEIFAKDVDLGEHEKKILVNMIQAGEGGLNVKSLFVNEANPQNLARAKDRLVSLGLIDDGDMQDFFVVNQAGKESLIRAGLIDDSEALIDTNASKYLDQNEDGDAEAGTDDLGGLGGF